MDEKKQVKERTHFDETDFAGLLTDQEDTQEVRVPEKGLDHVLSVRLDADDLRKLTRLAKEQGVGTTTMARMLLRQTLRGPRQGLPPHERTRIDALLAEIRELFVAEADNTERKAAR